MSELTHEPKHTTRIFRRGEGAHSDAECDPRSRQRRGLVVVLALCTCVMGLEFAGFLLSGSVALMADAFHFFSDVLTTLISLVAVVLASRDAPPERTFRYWRMEVLAALFNGILLVPLTGLILWESYERYAHPREIEVGTLFAAASIGLAASLTSAAFLHRQSKRDLNIRSAWLHAIGDSASSLGAIGAGLVILLWGWNVVDPLVASLVALLILASALRLVRDSISILLESAPRGVRLQEVKAALCEVPGVADVHDLHLWVVTSQMYMLTTHVVTAEDAPVSRTDELARRMSETLDRRFDINHACFQFEHGSEPRPPDAAS